MATPDELDQLSTRELHDRAVKHAVRHLDVKFFWNLIEMIPAAEMVAGETNEAEFDGTHAASQVAEALDADEDGKVGLALRPIYIDYLGKHPDS